VALASLVAPLPAAPAPARGCAPPPVTGIVTDPFRMPRCRWCPGNRGIEWSTPSGTRVTASFAGHVTFVGVVAGMPWLVVLDDDGLRATYGRVPTGQLAVRVGDRVDVGQVLGVSAGAVYLGLRDSTGAAVDPTPLLGRWRQPPWLVPTDGSPGRPGPAPRLLCGITSARR
jgi:murein DD-endopeptidase MepM/ murein hydrolase activator NlpD